MRPALKPALRRLWRDQTTLQLGIDPDRYVLIEGVDDRAAVFVHALDGTRDLAETLEIARRQGVRPAHATALLDALAEAGLLDDATTDTAVWQRLDLAERDRLGPDLAAMSLQSGAVDGGMATLASRRDAYVEVRGLGRVGAAVARLLAAAGVGRVVPRDRAPVRAADVVPGGLGVRDIGGCRQQALARALREEFPTLRTGPAGHRRRPDLVVIAPADTPEVANRDEPLRRGVPHLYVRVQENRGIVGPLVLPGISSCLRCHDHHRADRDNGWPVVAAQLSTGARHTTNACDAVLATLVAAQATLQALGHLQGGATSTVDAVWEVTLPTGAVRQLPRAAHPRCGCVPTTAAAETPQRPAA